jgi:hypothetical protein
VFFNYYRRLITITSGVTQRFCLFDFVCLRIVFSFVDDDYCANTVSRFYHTLTVFMVHLTVLCF